MRVFVNRGRAVPRAKRTVGTAPLCGILHFHACNLKLLLMEPKCLLQRGLSSKARRALMLISCLQWPEHKGPLSFSDDLISFFPSYCSDVVAFIILLCSARSFIDKLHSLSLKFSSFFHILIQISYAILAVIRNVTIYEMSNLGQALI